MNESQRSEGEFYEYLWKKGLQAYKNMDFEIDTNLMDKSQDKRLGITLIIRNGFPSNDAFKQFYILLRHIDPYQHYYENTELHITVLNIVEMSKDFQLSHYPIDKYISILQEIFYNLKSFPINYCGVCGSPGAVIIQGYDRENRLNMLRDKIRIAFRDSGLPNSIDVRYKAIASHLTLMRFRTQPFDIGKLWSLIVENRNVDFGASTISNIELVCADWYMSREKIDVLAKFTLQSN